MNRLRLRRSSAALTISTVALIVALGGTSYAAFSLPRNSVGTRQLKNGAVTSSKIKNGSVTGVKIAKGAITATNINLSELGTVPSANVANHAISADAATNAGHASMADNSTNANSVGGNVVTKVFFHRAAGAALVQVYSADGLLLKAGCNDPGNRVVVLATGTSPQNTAHLYFQARADFSATAYDEEVATLGTSVHGLNASANNGSGLFDYWTSDGHVITMTYGFSTNDPSDGGCSFSGVAIASS